MKVTVVIPAKNESGGIADVVRSALAVSAEVIVVDGHSSDRTADLAREAGARVVVEAKRGKGAAYVTGIREATGDVIVFMDADGSHEAADIPKVVAPIAEGRVEFVIASRHRGGSDEWAGDLDTWLRAMGSGFLSVVMNRRWGTNLTDVLNGFRAVRSDVARQVPLHATDFDVEQHMIAQYLRAGYRVTEVASHEYCRKWGASKLPTYRKAWLFFFRLFLDVLP